jgi:hypothetical protein
VFGDFEIGGQLIRSAKYVNGLVLLAKGETVLQGMIDKLIEIGRLHGVEINVGKPTIQIMVDYKQPKIWNISAVWVP